MVVICSVVSRNMHKSMLSAAIKPINSPQYFGIAFIKRNENIIKKYDANKYDVDERNANCD